MARAIEFGNEKRTIAMCRDDNDYDVTLIGGEILSTRRHHIATQ